MKITMLLKSGPRTDEAQRAFVTASDMLAQGHDVALFLLQEAVRFCAPGLRVSDTLSLEQLIEKGLKVYALSNDLKLRGIDETLEQEQILKAGYDSLVDLMDASDRVMGIL